MHTPRPRGSAKRSALVTGLFIYAIAVTGLLFSRIHSQAACGLVVKPTPMSIAPAVLLSQSPVVLDKGDRGPRRTRHLVVSHYKENLTWLHEGWGATSTHTIYEMARQPGILPDFSTGFSQYLGNNRYALLNFADEGSGYMRFILDNYDNLPDLTVFLHGSPEPHNRHIGEWVNCLKPGIGDEPHFIFLTRRYVSDRCIIDDSGNSMLKRVKNGPRQGEEIDYGAFVAYWKSFPWHLLNASLSEPPRCVSFHCCAEFVATRAMIRSRPREFYATLWAHLLDFILDEKIAKTYHGMQTRSAGGILEHIWHMIFHKPVHMDKTTIAQYCDLMKPQCGPCQLPLPTAASN